MIQFLVFNHKDGNEYAFISLAVPVDVLELCSIPQILPHASPEASISVMSRSQPLSSFGATSLDHQAPVFGGHSGPEAVCLCASSVIRLKGALRHRNEFSFKRKP